MSTLTLRSGSVAMMTSQNSRLLFTPAPSGTAQVTTWLIFCGVALRPAWPRCAAGTPAEASMIPIASGTIRDMMIEYIDSMATFPRRIVCLTEETTETLYRLGAGDRVVGVSGYTARPPEARLKPRVSAFITARFEKIAALDPDLILAFSDLQADIVAELVRRGYPVVAFNQRSITEILQMILIVGGLVGETTRATALVAEMEDGLEAIRRSAAGFPHRPRVFFEEWDTPLISGIRWVEELVEVAGGETMFPTLRESALAKDRILDPNVVRDAQPDVILASWCGKKVRKATIRERAGWDRVPAVARDQIYEIKSTYILQPGPASLTEGVRQIHALLAYSLGIGVDPALAPSEALDPAADRARSSSAV
jgi:iron complex transport system substrate-binding protein